MLAVDVEKRLGDFSVAAKFEAPDGVTALFGPSGSGKTSIVNMVAGLRDAGPRAHHAATARCCSIPPAA